MPHSEHLRRTLGPLIQKKGVRATARSVGVHHTMLIDWMACRRDIGVTVLAKLANRFGLALELVDAHPPPKAPQIHIRPRRPTSVTGQPGH